MPNTVRKSDTAHDCSSASAVVCAIASPNRPKDIRSSSVFPREPHLRLDSVIALVCRRSPLATSTPDCGGSGVPPGTAIASTAAEATGIRAAAACARRDVADQAGQLRGGHGHDHRIRAPRRALVVAQHPPGPSAAMCRTAVCTQRSPLRRTNSSSSTR